MDWFSDDVINCITIKKFYSFFESHYDEGFHFPGEVHNFWECVYVLDGSICVSGDERVYDLTAGRIIFHKPMELHKFWVNSASGASLLIFSFSLEGQFASALKNRVFILSQEQQAIVHSMLKYVRSKVETFPVSDASSRYRAYLLPFKRICTYSQMLTAYIYQLLLSLIGEGNISEVSTAPEAIIFNKAVNYMTSRISHQPSVLEVAAFCNTSESTLKRIFSKYAGTSVHKYYIRLRINAAAELLKAGTSVAETADKLLFSSQAYFSTVFKRETGISPSEFK